MPPEAAGEAHGHLRLALRNVAQLFNSLDPSPFYEKDLDDDAERFLVSWAGELHPHADLRLTLFLKEQPAEADYEQGITKAIHHYFAERARLERASLLRLLRQGRMSLAIGLFFLALCTAAAQALAASLGPLSPMPREGLLIAGWVAMWRPLQIYLYDWWPLWGRERLYRRLARMPVTVRLAGAA